MGKELTGVDVSSYQGVINWPKVKAAGIDFAILKVIRKDMNPDKQFETNWQGCLNAGVPIQGVYNYTYATNVQKAVNDARKVLSILGPNRHPMVWLDYEDASLPKNALAADIINAYGDVITAGGCKFGVYFGKSYYDTYLSKIWSKVKPEYRIGWIARYPSNAILPPDKEPDVSKKPKMNGIMYGWQYSSKGSVEGITGNTDLNKWYVDVEALNVNLNKEESEYGIANFVKDSREVWGVAATSSAKEIVEKSVTVSVRMNNSHNIVTPLEKYMKSLGYYTGKVEADNGGKPEFGNGMKKAIILYQANVVKAAVRYQDGELTSKGATWKKLYGAK